MLKEDFEKIAGRKIDSKEFEQMIKPIWLKFGSLSIEEVTNMYFSPDDEIKTLFDEGYELSRELDILLAKAKAYEKKVHAANLGKPLLNIVAKWAW